MDEEHKIIERVAFALAVVSGVCLIILLERLV